MRIIPFLRGLCATALIFVAAPATAQIQLIPVVSGLSSPLFVGHAGDGSGRLFIVEQEGIIKVLQSGSSTPTVFLNITSRVLEGGERGLLGLAFHPLYASNRRFLVFYTQQTDGALVIAEYLASSTNPDVAGTAERRILQIPDHLANHNGGMLAFGNDGYLYIGVGDGGGSYDPDANAQNLNSLMGKLLRIDVDRTDGGNQYASPSDNPFVGIDGRDEIYSYGLRNPWRFSFDRLTGEPWVGDVGQGAREEVDTPMVSGGNYGWPILEGTVCTPQHPGCSSAGTQLPRFEYTHSGGRCSLTGGYVYRGSSGTMPSGGYVYGDYCTGEIFSWDGSQQTLLLDTSALISSFGEDEQGELYVVDLNGSVSRVATSISDPHITSPTPGSTLSGPTEQFAWSAGTGVSSYWLYVGSSQGAADIFNQDMGTSLSATVAGIPTDGRTIYVRFWWFRGGWFSVDFQFTAATGGSGQNPQITSPPPGSTLTGHTQQFTWSAGTGASRYWLYLGSSQGAADTYNADQGSALSATVSGIPTDSRTLHARLWWLRGGNWEFADFQFTAHTGSGSQNAQITSPTPGSTLAGSTQLFVWSAGINVTRYWLYVGSSAGARDIYDQDLGTALNATVTGIPTDGRTIHVRLWYLHGTWQFADFQFTTAGGLALIGGPHSPRQREGGILALTAMIPQGNAGRAMSPRSAHRHQRVR